MALDSEEICELRDVWAFLSEIVGWLNASCGYADMSKNPRHGIKMNAELYFQEPRRAAALNQSPKELLRYFNDQDLTWPSRKWLSCAEEANTVLDDLCRMNGIATDAHGKAFSILDKARVEEKQECTFYNVMFRSRRIGYNNLARRSLPYCEGRTLGRGQ